MVDPNEIEALKASMRGAIRSADTLRELAERVAALEPHVEVSDADLDDLHRVTSAHAMAAQALRGFVETMLKRRGKEQKADSVATSGEDEP
jgi:hypothetical protein